MCSSSLLASYSSRVCTYWLECADTLRHCVQAVVAHTGEVTAIAAAPAGNYLVTGGADFQVC